MAGGFCNKLWNCKYEWKYNKTKYSFTMEVLIFSEGK